MSINPFKLERFFAKYEFKVKYLLSSSDCESLAMAELIQMASPASLELWQGLRLGYTESPGHPLLRAEVARLYQHISLDFCSLKTEPPNTPIRANNVVLACSVATLNRPAFSER
jgi:hypothetical protein